METTEKTESKTERKVRIRKSKRPADAPAYEVLMQDEYDNLYLLGFYASLREAVPDVNEFLEPYLEDGAIPFKDEDLMEYASTFGSCFDREVEWADDDRCPGCLMVRGFALSAAKLKAGMEKLLAEADKED